MLQKINADNKDRIETGALQINDDWPGLFIRGDDCIMLRTILDAGTNDPDMRTEIFQEMFADDLIRYIENDVQVR